MRKNQSQLSMILETYLPAVLAGDVTHKDALIKAISTLQSHDDEAELLNHLKQIESLYSCDPEVLLVLFQWVQRLMKRPGLVISTEIKQSNWQWALEALRIAAEEKTYPPALFISSSIYLTGIPNILSVNRPKCLAHLKEAADLGYAKAQHDYAENCMTGAGELLTKNLDEAVEYHLLAANQNVNFPPSQAALGMIYLKIKNNREEGIEWLTKAAENKHPLAAYELAKLYSTDNQQESLRYLKIAADSGHLSAQYEHARNIQNKEDPTEYLRYLTSAAFQNHPQAKLDIQRVNPELFCRALVTLNKKGQLQEQRIQRLEEQVQFLIKHTVKSPSVLKKDRIKLSENTTILGSSREPASDDSDSEYQDALTGLEKS